MFLKLIFLLVFCSYIGARRVRAFVVLDNIEPAVLGGNVTLRATVTDRHSDGIKIFIFQNVNGPEYAEIFSSEDVVNCTFQFSKNNYKAGVYTFEVKVYGKDNAGLYKLPYGRELATVILTDLINGNLVLFQNGYEKSNDYVIANVPVNHTIKIPDGDLGFIARDPSYTVVWYLNCSLIGITKDFSLTHTYYDTHNPYNLEVVVIVNNENMLLTTITTTTTTTTPQPQSNYVVKSNNTTVHNITKRYIDAGMNGYKKLDHFKCATPKDGYTYGYYNRTIHVRRKVSTTTERSSWRRSTTPYLWTTPVKIWSDMTTSTPITTEQIPWETSSIRQQSTTTDRSPWRTSPTPYGWTTTVKPWSHSTTSTTPEPGAGRSSSTPYWWTTPVRPWRYSTTSSTPEPDTEKSPPSPYWWTTTVRPWWYSTTPTSTTPEPRRRLSSTPSTFDYGITSTKTAPTTLPLSTLTTMKPLHFKMIMSLLIHSSFNVTLIQSI